MIEENEERLKELWKGICELFLSLLESRKRSVIGFSCEFLGNIITFMIK